MSGVDGKVVKITKKANKYGVYEATVEIGNVGKEQISTFFPKAWIPQQVVDAINEAFSNKVKKTTALYEGTTKEGMKIRMYVENGKITTAYPVY